MGAVLTQVKANAIASFLAPKRSRHYYTYWA